MIKRILALMLVLCMAVGFLPAGVSAFTEEQELTVDAVLDREPDVLEPMTQSRTNGFVSGYELTGKGAVDMVTIALMQEGRTGRQFGYTESWCANFVGDCAILAGQGEAVPQYGGVREFKNRIMEAGGRITTSNPQPGDICFIDWDKRGGYDHVEIVYQVSGKNVFTIGGNSGSANSLSSRFVKKHDPINPDTITCIVRPSYVPATPSNPKMWVEDTNMPQSIPYGTGFDLTGNIYSNNGVKQVSLVLYNGDQEAMQTAERKISDYQNVWPLAELDDSLDLAGLACGAYALAVESFDKDDNFYSVYTQDFTVICEHDYTCDVLAPTCTEGGHTSCLCTVCGDSYVDGYTDALGHAYEDLVLDATCTKTGFTTHTCTLCGDSYVDAQTKALGHAWEDTDCTRCDAVRVANFDDVLAGNFYAEPVRWAVEHAITNGTSATAFSPSNACNRAQVVTFLWRAAGAPEPGIAEHPFEDVPQGSFYEKAILWAVENGVTNGVDASHFRPAAPCSRVQVVTFLYRAQGDPARTAADCPFSDVASGAWFEDAILWAVENGVTNGLGNGAFGVSTVCNRAQVVTFLHRAYVD